MQNQFKALFMFQLLLKKWERLQYHEYAVNEGKN